MCNVVVNILPEIFSPLSSGLSVSLLAGLKSTIRRIHPCENAFFQRSVNTEKQNCHSFLVFLTLKKMFLVCLMHWFFFSFQAEDEKQTPIFCFWVNSERQKEFSLALFLFSLPGTKLNNWLYTDPKEDNPFSQTAWKQWLRLFELSFGFPLTKLIPRAG